MSRYVDFVTPENIEIRYELAGIGSRFVAALLDHSIQAGVLIALFLLGWGIASALSAGPIFGGGAVTYWFGAIYGIASFLILFGYFSLFELLWAGRTPGKRAAGLRVVRDGGYPIDVYTSIVRNLVRIADLLLPPIYGGGLVSMFISRENKRLGDWAAGTLVVKERPPERLGVGDPGPPTPNVAHYLRLLPSTDGLTTEEFLTIRQFVARRKRLEPLVQAHLAKSLAIPLIQRLGLSLPVSHDLHYADILEAIERRYIEEHGVL